MAALVRHEGMTVVAAEPDLVARDGRVWTALDPAVAPRPPGLSMAGGWIGLLSYGMGRTLEHLPRPRPFPDGPPMGVVGRYPTVAIIDGSGRARVASTAGAQACARLAECLAGAGTAPQHPHHGGARSRRVCLAAPIAMPWNGCASTSAPATATRSTWCRG